MTDELHDLLSGRADRARPPGDPESVVALVAEHAETRTRTRRNRLAIASGAAVLVAAATVGFAIADGGGSPQGSAPGQAGGRPPGTSSASPTVTATELPEFRPLHGTATAPGLSLKAAAARQLRLRQRELAAAAQRLQRVRARQALAARHTALVPVDPAPKQAEISIGLVPRRFAYLSLDDADTYYGLPGTPDQPNFRKEIVVDVHLTVQGTPFPITVDGKPGSYYTSGGYTIVRIRYNNRIDVGFQAPPSASLTKKQALDIASTIDVRSTKHTTKG